LLLLRINALKHLDVSFNQSSSSVNFIIVTVVSSGGGSRSTASSKGALLQNFKKFAEREHLTMGVQQLKKILDILRGNIGICVNMLGLGANDITVERRTW
jgi:hypothetical protein